jgi:hypothetical protein
MRLPLWIFASIVCLASSAQDLSINEFMAVNETTIQDEDGDYSDWIEIYNAGAEAVDLSGWHLSDDVTDAMKWQIGSAQIQAGEFLLVFASSKDRTGPGELHTNFKISSSGEALLLSDPSGLLISETPSTMLSADVSYGSIEDGMGDAGVTFIESSPGVSNSKGTIEPISDVIHYSVVGGFYENGFGLELDSEEGAEIRYTTDGSEPKVGSNIYSSEIAIQDRQGEEDVISLINTGFRWEAPEEMVEKATVIKAASFVQGFRISPVFTETYFVSDRIDRRYEGVPVISLSIDEDSLFSSERGIYVAGEGLESSEQANYYQKGPEWERRMHFEFFDKEHEKQLAHDVGARIHGKSSRNQPQKTLRLYARNSYGASHFEYPFFESKDIDRFKRILLRSSSTDYGSTIFRDVLASELVSDMEVDYMASQECIVFINGEYWGLHSIRERIDEHFLAANHPVDPDSLDLLALDAEVEEGSADDYLELLDYVRSHDLRDESAYQEVVGQMDLDNFMDYYIAQMYFANSDWPFVNIRYWKGHSEEDRWRWIFHDCDRCLLSVEYDHLGGFVHENVAIDIGPEWTTVMFSSLIKNETFKKEFIQRFFYRLSDTFRGYKVMAKIDELEAIHRPLVAEQVNRWHYPESVNYWYESIEEMRGFLVRRPGIMVGQILNYLGEHYSLYPNPVEQARGYVNLDMEYTEGLQIQVQIFTPQGQQVQQMDLGHVKGEVHPQIPIDRLSPGLYIMRIQHGVLVFSEKLVVE